MNCYPILRALLFQLDAERAHHLALSALKYPALAAVTSEPLVDPRLSRQLFGLHFPNPVGLAAGLDKNAEAIDGLAQLGFGFVEIGTITPKPQEGNPKPRLFRLKEDEALINRMGFNNVGALAAARNLSARKSSVIVGGNIGKNKTTPNEDAANDYIRCFSLLHEVVDYFVVNVSSPNTPGLRELQDRDSLERILNTLQEANAALTIRKPLLLKIAPDLNESQLEDIVSICEELQMSGLVATNTTMSREKLPHFLPSEIESFGAGGLSGKPLRERATEVVTTIHRLANGRLPVIGVGGIMSADDGLEKFEAGASLIQLYSGFVYHGPRLIQEICSRLIQE
ncbi:MAG: quinone-dependent dihydroorotate dehydrogenase [Chitinophagales bacterium]